MQMTIEEVITESLEADNLQLQNMSTSKYVQVNIQLLGLPLASIQALLFHFLLQAPMLPAWPLLQGSEQDYTGMFIQSKG